MGSFLLSVNDMPHAIVLMIGQDRSLIETRAGVLRLAGYTVVPSLPKHAVNKFLAGDFDLVLLCHSIPQEDRERVAHKIREHTSRTPIISVTFALDQKDSFTDATIHSDPNQLIAGLHAVLNQMGNNPRGGERHG
jgi:DNA-binding response OmpR family regulator